MILDILALVLQLIGVFFLVAAVVGVIRFADPLQRMHASSKAGTVGAGFVVLGVIVEMGRLDVTAIGLATVIFLLLTVPIAGHLLGRATYVSGAKLDGLRGEDELRGVLERSEVSLDESLDRSRAPADEEPQAKG